MQEYMIELFSIVSNNINSSCDDIISTVFSIRNDKILRQIDRKSFIDFVRVLKGTNKGPSDIISYIYLKLYDEYRRNFLGGSQNAR